MMLIKGKAIKSADEICNTCRHEHCFFMEHLEQIEARAKGQGANKIVNVVVRSCGEYEELLP